MYYLTQLLDFCIKYSLLLPKFEFNNDTVIKYYTPGVVTPKCTVYWYKYSWSSNQLNNDNCIKDIVCQISKWLESEYNFLQLLETANTKK